MAIPVVSFCIPTYNRAERVCALVTSILSCERDDIEVCVNDNASTDNTKEILSHINDSRFKFFENEANIGMYKNMVISISRASGKYAFYCNDRDLIIAENIPRLCDFLSNYDLVYVYCGEVFKEIIYENYCDSVTNLYFFRHPSGEIFGTRYLAQIDLKYYLELSEDSPYMLAFRFIFLSVAMKGKTACLPNVYWEAPSMDFLDKNPSRSQLKSGAHPCIYFIPRDMSKIFLFDANHLANIGAFTKSELSNILYIQYKKRAIQSLTFYIDSMSCDTITMRYSYNGKTHTGPLDWIKRYFVDFYQPYRKSNIYNYNTIVQRFKIYLFNIYMLQWFLFYKLKRMLLKNRFIYSLNLLRRRIFNKD
ncbi:MAG: glycosyltransferase [Helicobacteraceae bacterium]|jgi:glycosyltransferase involved in cell wall biosynthesis|nr:glycosyltransferase [Helicobacteraceae bacterium]